MSKDEEIPMGLIALYHGSAGIVEKPIFNAGKEYKDFGQGFYCTEDEELAKEWACTALVDGFINKYDFDIDKMNVLDLTTSGFSLLSWVAIVLKNRKIHPSTPAMKKAIEWIRDNFCPELKGVDVIKGYRADDSYLSYIKAFMKNEISLEQLGYAMAQSEVGTELVLVSKKAFNNINFDYYDIVDNRIYFPKRKYRDENARLNLWNEQEKNETEGLFVRDVMEKEMRLGDERIW